MAQDCGTPTIDAGDWSGHVRVGVGVLEELRHGWVQLGPGLTREESLLTHSNVLFDVRSLFSSSQPRHLHFI